MSSDVQRFASNLTNYPVYTVVRSFGLTLFEVGINVVLSTFLEWLFPPYQPQKNIWLSALEALGEFTLHIVIGNTLLAFVGGSLHPMGALIPWGSIVGIWLLTGAIQKAAAFQRYFLGGQPANSSKPAADKAADADADDVVA